MKDAGWQLVGIVAEVVVTKLKSREHCSPTKMENKHLLKFQAEQNSNKKFRSWF